MTFVDGIDGTVIDEQQVYEEQDAIEPPHLDYEDYTFTGWSTDFTYVQEDSTVVAVYKRIYTVNFLDVDGSTLKSEQVLEGEDATPPIPPSKTGYSFSKWNGSYTEVMSDIDLEPVFYPRSYTMYYNLNGGRTQNGSTSIAPKIVKYDAPYGNLASAIVFDGHSFDGWYLDD